MYDVPGSILFILKTDRPAVPPPASSLSLPAVRIHFLYLISVFHPIGVFRRSEGASFPRSGPDRPDAPRDPGGSGTASAQTCADAGPAAARKSAAPAARLSGGAAVPSAYSVIALTADAYGRARRKGALSTFPILSRSLSGSSGLHEPG